MKFGYNYLFLILIKMETSKTKKVYKCSVCNKEGHNKKTCKNTTQNREKKKKIIIKKKTTTAKESEPKTIAVSTDYRIDTCSICFFDDRKIVKTKCDHELCEVCIQEVYECPFCRTTLREGKPQYKPPEMTREELMDFAEQNGHGDFVPQVNFFQEEPLNPFSRYQSEYVDMDILDEIIRNQGDISILFG